MIAWFVVMSTFDWCYYIIFCDKTVFHFLITRWAALVNQSGLTKMVSHGVSSRAFSSTFHELRTRHHHRFHHFYHLCLSSLWQEEGKASCILFPTFHELRTLHHHRFHHFYHWCLSFLRREKEKHELQTKDNYDWQRSHHVGCNS